MVEQGRPLKYKKAEDMSVKIDEYFDMCDKKNKPYTITGLCLHLDVDRSTLLRYQENTNFHNTIKRAKMRVENYIEEQSINGKLNATVSIFNLKNNFGWKDKYENEVKNNNRVTIVDDIEGD